MKFISYTLVFVLATLLSCRNDTIEIIGPDSNTPTISISTVEGTVAGLVFNNEKQAIANATIDINGQLTQSDEEGLFFFISAELNPLGTYIKVEKEGYILGSDLIYPGKGINRAYIQMMELSTNTTFQASNGGTVQIERGGSIEFDPNAISSEIGGTYTGEVYVTAKRLATDDPDLDNKMPGGLKGQDKANRTVVLGTLGMVAVELRGANGEELNLKTGSTAKVSFPIASKDQATAPETVPLWYFDELRGKWIEEGSATKQGNTYIGNVTHFSFWNCDVPFPLINFSVKIFNVDGSPAQSAKVKICAGSLGTSSGYTSDGSINGKIPKNELLTIKVFGNGACDQVIYTADVGPFANDVQLDNIQLEENEKYTLSGQVICDQTPVTNSVVVIAGASFRDVVQTDEQGNYTYTTCFEGDIAVFGKDLDTNEGSLTQEVTLDDNTSAVNLNLNTCSDCPYEVEILVDNNSCDSLSILTAVVNSNVPFEYSWSNGATGSTIENILPGDYAVTVVEVSTGCQKVVTVKVVSSEHLLYSFDIKEVDCETNAGGEIFLAVDGGTAPYTYQWTNEGGDFLGTASSLLDLEAGNYLVTVTDNEGCTISGTINLPSTGLNLDPIQTEFELNCSTPIIELGFDNGVGLTYQWNTGASSPTIQINEAGTYILIVTNSAGCSETFEFQITEDFEIPTFQANLACDGLLRFVDVDLFNNPNLSFEVFSLNGEVISTQGAQASYYLFEYPGNPIEVIVTDNSNGCQSSITLADNFTSTNLLEVTSSSPPSCDGCNDGSIEANIIDVSNCVNCFIDVYKEIGQGIYESVTTANDNGQLGVGKYYIALTGDMSCVTEFLIVEF